MAVLRLKNKKYTVQLLRAFTGKKQVTFEISEEVLKVYSISPPVFSLSIPNTLYEIDRAVVFTVNTADLLQNIDLLDADTVVLDRSFKMVTAFDSQKDNRVHGLLVGGGDAEDIIGAHGCSFIDIPFVGPIQGGCRRVAEFSTRLMINKNVLKHFLCGVVTYSNEDGLVLRKDTTEEVMRVDVEYLEKGYLSFSCTNDWVGGVNACLDTVTTVLFGFAEGLLCIRLLFAGQDGVCMEVQVPEKMSGTA